ncbi:MAG TPA: PD-(D/E)XK nuclease family protein [Acidimicrobiia bacterium]
MQVTTTGRKPKPFAWSYSKLKNYETCPKRSWHLDHARDIKEEESEQLQYGNTLHKVLADAIAGKAPLPKHFAHLQPWVDKVTAGGNAATILVEQQLAITKNIGPTEWFGKDAWYRGIADVIKIVGPVAAVLDWKTGKILEDGVQLALMAQCVFAHHPEIQKIRTEFIWLKEDAVTRADFSRDDMAKVWAGVLPRVQSLENAIASANFPPKPGFLCRKWCPVAHCPHNGH